MKKRIISVSLILCLLFASAVTAAANRPGNLAVTEDWGTAVQKYMKDLDGGAIARSLDPAEGNKVVLPKMEIDMAKEFYITAGYEEGKALELAIEYVKEINTLYQEAIRNGYSVTEDEIAEHLDQMKTEYQTAENRDEIYSFIGTFENEQAYWDFQFEMFKKDLPIQKYLADKEREFIEGNISNLPSGRSYSEQEYSDKVLELQEDWAEKFINMKADAKSKYDFIVE